MSSRLPSMMLLLFIGNAAFAANDVIVRTTLTPESPVAVGDRVLLEVDVLGKDSWASLQSIPMLEVSGAIIYSPPSQSQRLNETIESNEFSGQRYQWWIYPQRAGEIEVPQISLSVIDRVLGSSTDAIPETLSSETKTIEVKRRDGAAGEEGLIATTSLEAKQTWSDQPERLTVGDGISRTVTRVIDSSPSLLLKPVSFTELDGVDVMVRQSTSEDKTNRGELVGHRTDSATYLFRRPGDFEIPPIIVRWIDQDSQTLREQTLAGLKVSVSTLPQVDDLAIVDEAGSQASNRWWLVLTACVLIFALAIGFRNQLIAQWQRFVVWRTTSERALFLAFKRIAKAGEPSATLRALTTWWDSVSNDPAPRLDDFFARHGTRESLEQLQQLNDGVDARRSQMDLATLIIQVANARKRCRKSWKEQAEIWHEPLPQLRLAKSPDCD